MAVTLFPYLPSPHVHKQPHVHKALGLEYITKGNGVNIPKFLESQEGQMQPYSRQFLCPEWEARPTVYFIPREPAQVPPRLLPLHTHSATGLPRYCLAGETLQLCEALLAKQNKAPWRQSLLSSPGPEDNVQLSVATLVEKKTKATSRKVPPQGLFL